jgi:ABC-type branched-subunit amino acid transport system ATPase component
VKRFGGVVAVDNLSVSFEPGKVTALIGPNGAGKTTLFHLIAGALRPDSGAVVYRGRRVDRLPAWQRARMGIGRLFQDVRIFHRMTAIENVCTACQGQLGENPLLAVLLPRNVVRQEKRNARHARELLETVGISEFENALAQEMSFGQQKLLAIARLIVAGSDVMLLDEPTSGISPSMMDGLQAMIRTLAAEGRTIVVIEHNMDVVLQLADWVHFMDQGQIVAFGSPADVLSDRSVRLAYLGA